MFGAAHREISMRRIAGALGWVIAALYFGAVLVVNYVIVSDLYYPEGPWPGWLHLIEANALYGGGGVIVVLVVRLGWRRWLINGRASHPLPT